MDIRGSGREGLRPDVFYRITLSEGRAEYNSAKGGKPAVTAVLSAPITGLSFNATGSRLAVTDGTGWLVIWTVEVWWLPELVK